MWIGVHGQIFYRSVCVIRKSLGTSFMIRTGPPIQMKVPKITEQTLMGHEEAVSFFHSFIHSTDIIKHLPCSKHLGCISE